MPNNDYILRSDALKAILGVSIYDAIEELEGARTIAENTWADGLYDAYKIVEEEVDAADVEPVRHGRWVGMKEYCQHLFDITRERYIMSQLGISRPHCNQCWAENESRKPFCPNCGAKMLPEPPKENPDAEYGTEK